MVRGDLKPSESSASQFLGLLQQDQRPTAQSQEIPDLTHDGQMV